ncbi:hypothetical protein EIP91_001208 [Steccherinum ochraceum]|uniref:Uncharacterized protein n=1 Tax=Steccherinum ochraceum TaxID=92696 RepID=A0A4R0RPW4_9APHY|nr:hypothetical protein EIP91_001208 [Steccherinum ochraceum]
MPLSQEFHLSNLPSFGLSIRNVIKVETTNSSGYLFDAFSLSRQSRPQSYILADTLLRLREKRQEYKDVVILHDDVHEQFFFVHAPLLLERCHQEFGIKPLDNEEAKTPNLQRYTNFILLDDQPRVLHEIPQDVRSLFEVLCPVLHAAISGPSPIEFIVIPSPHELSIQDIVPFAAIILEYPVAYVPLSAEQDSFLPWEVLDVYECVLLMDGSGGTKMEHVMCKFSCPECLSHHGALQVSQLRTRLKDLFSARLMQVDVQGQVEVRHHQETHERVAL